MQVMVVVCGHDHRGGLTLIDDYLDNWRGIFVRYAGNVLAEKKP